MAQFIDAIFESVSLYDVRPTPMWGLLAHLAATPSFCLHLSTQFCKRFHLMYRRDYVCMA